LREGPRSRSDSPWRDDAYAVVIGINTYLDPKIPNLRFAREDAEAVYQVLTDAEVGRFKPEHVTLLLDGEATQRKIRSALGTKLPRQAPRESTVCIYYAGHGAPEIDTHHRSADGIEKYLVPHDAQADDLWSSGISMEAVQQIFSRLSANQVVCFLDCCYSGAAGGRSFEREGFRTRALLSDEFLDSLASEGRLVVTACATSEVSLESQDRGHGLFTHHLVEGLRGAADADGNGRVTIDELYDYVYHQVERDARSMGGSMRPVRKGSVQGRVYLTEYETATKKGVRLASERAAAAWTRGDVGEAEAAWNEALALDAAHEPARSGLARIAERRAQEQAALEEERRLREKERRRRQRLLLGFFESDQLSADEYHRALELLDADPATLDSLDRPQRKLLDSLIAGSLTPKTYHQSLAALAGEPAHEAVAGDAPRDIPSTEPDTAPPTRISAPEPPPVASAARLEQATEEPESPSERPSPSAEPHPFAQSARLERPRAAKAAIVTRSSYAKEARILSVVAMMVLAAVLYQIARRPTPEDLPAWPEADRGVRFSTAAWGLPADGLWGFVEIPAGVFRMGSDSKTDPEADTNELPQHVVTLPDYFIGKYEVTVGQYKACVKDGGCAPRDGRALDGADDFPVRWVSWREAVAYCDWLDGKLRQSPETPTALADALAGRRDGRSWRITLPSEPEWERAARGTEARIYPWGNAAPDASSANYDATGKGDVVAVGSFPAGRTPEGLYDLAGNVSEWTSSYYGPYPYVADGRRESLGAGGSRVYRGGLFRSSGAYMRAAYRTWLDADSRCDSCGFRLVASRLRP
jgi:formylglycine-generating enzyme required for sulfatase activity/uncharacterized caspase-like protein